MGTVFLDMSSARSAGYPSSEGKVMIVGQSENLGIAKGHYSDSLMSLFTRNQPCFATKGPLNTCLVGLVVPICSNLPS